MAFASLRLETRARAHSSRLLRRAAGGGERVSGSDASPLLPTLRVPFARWRRGLVRRRSAARVSTELGGRVLAFAAMKRGRSAPHRA